MPLFLPLANTERDIVCSPLSVCRMEGSVFTVLFRGILTMINEAVSLTGYQEVKQTVGKEREEEENVHKYENNTEIKGE